MKLRISISFIIYLSLAGNISTGQTLTNTKVTQSTDYFNNVRDSIIKLTNPTNSIFIKTAEGISELYLTNDNLHWKGYLIKNLAVNSPRITELFLIEGVPHYKKPIITTLVLFDADSLYKMLVIKNLYNIKQITHAQIEELYNQNIKKKDKNIMYGIPYNSHDINMTICINNTKQTIATYRYSLIEYDELHFIPTIKIFYDIEELLRKTFENY